MGQRAKMSDRQARLDEPSSYLGGIEQTADVVAILHPHPMPGKSPADVMELEYPQVDLWVEKHRDGAEMCIPLSFEKRVLRFVNIARNRDGA